MKGWYAESLWGRSRDAREAAGAKKQSICFTSISKKKPHRGDIMVASKMANGC